MIQYQRAQLFYYCKENDTTPVESFMEEHKLCHIFSGALQITYEGKRFLLHQGDTVFFRRNLLVRASLLPDENKQPFTCSKIILSEEFIRNFCITNKPVTGQHTKGKGPSNQFYTAINNELAIGFFQSLKPYLNPENKISQELSLHKTKELLMILDHLWPGIEQTLFDFNDPGKTDIGLYMKKNYAHNISLEKFAYLTGRSLTTFKRDFVRTFGIPPHKWIVQRRLNEALHLIQEKGAAPSNVYLEVGFESLAHFSTAFKKQFGYSPSNALKQ